MKDKKKKRIMMSRNRTDDRRKQCERNVKKKIGKDETKTGKMRKGEWRLGEKTRI